MLRAARRSRERRAPRPTRHEAAAAYARYQQLHFATGNIDHATPHGYYYQRADGVERAGTTLLRRASHAPRCRPRSYCAPRRRYGAIPLVTAHARR